MIVLAIDATTDRLSVAVGRRGGDISTRLTIGARRHAALLGSLVEGVLQESGLSLDRIEAIAIADGPGSFTGLRVAAAWAKGLARARQLPIWTASTLMVRALAAPSTGRLVAGVGWALRGEWYLGVYRFDPDGAIATVASPTVIGAKAQLPRASELAAIVGDLPDAELRRLAGAPGLVIGPPGGLPEAGRLIELIGRPGGAMLIGDPSHWEPSYGRPAEAQAKWEREHGGEARDPLGVGR